MRACTAEQFVHLRSAGDALTRSGFFYMGHDTFLRACNLGINPVAAFLVLAHGTGGDNTSTKWSAEAAADRPGTRWTTAKTAIAQLAASRLVTIRKGSTRPAYALAKKGTPIWLPNALVDGAASEVPPVAHLRQTQDPLALRLFVELYGEQNLRDDGGVKPSVIWMAYERERIGQRGAHVVWRFHGGRQWVSWSSDVTKPHSVRLTVEERQAGKDRAEDFFRRLGHIQSLGLFEWVPYLFDGPHGEPIHPLNRHGAIEEEAALYAACAETAARCLTDAQHAYAVDKGGYLVPVPKHIERAQLIGVARLRYRPHTRLTAAWWADHTAKCRAYAERYAAIAADEAAEDRAVA